VQAVSTGISEDKTAFALDTFLDASYLSEKEGKQEPGGSEKGVPHPSSPNVKGEKRACVLRDGL